MTPAELNTYARAYAAQREQEHRLQLSLIYSHASLIRSMVWSKHPPRFDQAFPSGASSSPKAQMTDEQIYSIVQGLNALYGGKEVEECLS